MTPTGSSHVPLPHLSTSFAIYSNRVSGMQPAQSRTSHAQNDCIKIITLLCKLRANLYLYLFDDLKEYYNYSLSCSSYFLLSFLCLAGVKINEFIEIIYLLYGSRFRHSFSQILYLKEYFKFPFCSFSQNSTNLYVLFLCN